MTVGFISSLHLVPLRVLLRRMTELCPQNYGILPPKLRSFTDRQTGPVAGIMILGHAMAGICYYPW